MSEAARFLDEALPHLPVVHRLARQQERDPWAAEDLVQETLLRAFAGYRPDRVVNMRAWLVTICLNVSRSSARRRQRRVTEVPLDEAVDGAGEGADVFDEATRAVERMHVERALDMLPEEQRTCILLMDVAGLTAAETADVLGCPRGTVLSRVHRGRRRLGLILDPDRARRE